MLRLALGSVCVLYLFFRLYIIRVQGLGNASADRLAGTSMRHANQSLPTAATGHHGHKPSDLLCAASGPLQRVHVRLSALHAPGTTKRHAIQSLLINTFRAIMATTPSDLLPAVYLCVNRVAPAHAGIELGIGESTLIKVRLTRDPHGHIDEHGAPRPVAVLPAVHLCVRRMAPAHVGIELGTGELLWIKARLLGGLSVKVKRQSYSPEHNERAGRAQRLAAGLIHPTPVGDLQSCARPPCWSACCLLCPWALTSFGWALCRRRRLPTCCFKHGTSGCVHDAVYS